MLTFKCDYVPALPLIPFREHYHERIPIGGRSEDYCTHF